MKLSGRRDGKIRLGDNPPYGTAETDPVRTVEPGDARVREARRGRVIRIREVDDACTGDGETRYGYAGVAGADTYAGSADRRPVGPVEFPDGDREVIGNVRIGDIWRTVRCERYGRLADISGADGPSGDDRPVGPVESLHVQLERTRTLAIRDIRGAVRGDGEVQLAHRGGGGKYRRPDRYPGRSIPSGRAQSGFGGIEIGDIWLLRRRRDG